MKRFITCIMALVLLLCSVRVTPAQAAVTDSGTALKTMQTIGVVTAEQTAAGLQRNVSRQQFAKMLVKMSGYKDKVASQSKTSMYSDVKKSSSFAPYIKIAVDNGWMKGNLSGKFRPKKAVTLQEGVNAVIVLLGYTDADFNGSKSSAKWNFYQTEKLNQNISKEKNQKMTYNDAVNLLYNVMLAKGKDGVVYATKLGYTLDSDGNIDQLALIAKDLKGPFIASGNWSSKLPFAVNDAAVYINGKWKAPSEVCDYDVVYYHEQTKTVYVFRNKVTGKLTAVTPNIIEPSAVVVAGKTYSLSGQEVRYALSSMGNVEEGEYVTLLLGKDGTVVGIGKASEMNTTVGGIIIKGGKGISEEAEDATIVSYVEVLDTMGTVRRIEPDKGQYYYVGQPVEIDYTNNKPTLRKVSQKVLTGTVDSKATTLAGYGISSFVHIVEYSDNGNYAILDKSRLAGKNIGYGNVKYYHLNAQNEITDMIVKDITGDEFSYGILKYADEVNDEESGMRYGTYEILMKDGSAMTYSTNGYVLNMQGSTGPVQMSINEKGNLVSMRLLNSIEATSVTDVQIGNQTASYPLAEDVQVFVKSGSEYYPTTVSKVKNLDKFTLTAYYDNSVSGSIRIVIAKTR